MAPPHFTAEQVHVIVLAAYVSSILNLLGSMFTITTYLVFKEARNYGTSLIFNLALSDFCTAFANVFLVYLVNQEINAACKVQASMLLFGLIASMMWGLLIGVHLFLVLYKNMEFEEIRKFSLGFHLLAWGYPLIAIIIPLVKDKFILMFPDNMAWCFVPNPYRMFLFFPDTAVFFILAVAYCLIWITLRKAHNSAAQEICRKMSIYLLTYTCLNLFGIINRVQDYFFPGENVFVLYLLQFIFEPLQGFLNAIAYVWNEPAYIENYKRLFTHCTTQHVKPLSVQAEQEKLMSMVFYESEP